MPTNAINKGRVHGMYIICGAVVNRGSGIICTNDISEAHVIVDINHLRYCCKLHDLIMCVCLCEIA